MKVSPIPKEDRWVTSADNPTTVVINMADKLILREKIARFRQLLGSIALSLCSEGFPSYPRELSTNFRRN